MVLRKAVSPRADEPVTVLELFFDLVFVFIVTQVTRVVVDQHGYLRAAGILVVTWWIYNGYAWLTNNVTPTTPSTILPMLVGYLLFASATGLAIRVGHFAERHRLLLIIALGETIIAIGAGARGHLDDPVILLGIILAMVLISAMWWVYFIGDHHSQGERVLDETSPESRAQKGRWTYSVAHLILIAGLVLTAAGLHEVVHGPTRHLSLAGASTLASGVVLFLAGLVTFVRSLGIASGGHLLIAAAASVPTIALGTLINGAVQLAALALVLIALSVRANSATA